ncbi:hypothetical protein MUP46_04710 [Patescibacteria group bacterium]|nr:hypothetical protein [Patescibacteria group bacterium]
MMATDLVAGSWAALDNVLNSLNVGVQPSGFYPTPQRNTIKSETLQAAGGSGTTYRQTIPENQSWLESVGYALNGWLGSPYEAQYSKTAKTAESQSLAALVETKKPGPIDEGLDWALDTTKKIATVWDQLSGLFGKKREVITETPRAGSPEGKNVQNVNDTPNRSADVDKVFAYAGQIIDQVKGLFGLGYPQTMPQPAGGVQTELGGLAGLSMGTLAIAALIILLLTRK